MDADLSATYSISDLEKLSGIKAHTIRIWEKRYGVIVPRRTETNIRFYSNLDLKTLLNISLLNQSGYKISAISKFSPEELVAKVNDITFSQSDIIQEQLLLSLLDMDESIFNNAFDNMLQESNFEKAMSSVVFPFFKRIGIMWQAGTINPAQEHFFSNLVRAKIIAATEQICSVPVQRAETVLLFLLEGELHEIGLLFYNYAFRNRGYKTIYLGQSVPYESLSRIYGITSPSIVITNITNPVLPESFEDISKKICRQAGQAIVYFTGPLPENFHSKTPDNAAFTTELHALLN